MIALRRWVTQVDTMNIPVRVLAVLFFLFWPLPQFAAVYGCRTSVYSNFLAPTCNLLALLTSNVDRVHKGSRQRQCKKRAR